MKKKLSKRITQPVPRTISGIKNIQFPSIFRLFPETLVRFGVQSSRLFLINFVCGFTLMGIVVLGLQLRESYGDLQRIEQTRRTHKAQIQYWENVVADKPYYRDAYIKLASMHYMVGERKKALSVLEKALEIDPRFVAGYKLKEEITALF